MIFDQSGNIVVADLLKYTTVTCQTFLLVAAPATTPPPVAVAIRGAVLLASLDLPFCSETLQAGTAVTVSRAASLVVVAGLCTAGGAADLLLGVTTALTSSEPGLEEEEQQEAHDERPHFPLHLGQIIEGVSVKQGWR